MRSDNALAIDAKARISRALEAHSYGAAAAALDAGDPDRAAECFIDFWMGAGELAVSGCIEEERNAQFPDACASNTHFKKRLSAQIVRNGWHINTRPRSVGDIGTVVEILDAQGQTPHLGCRMRSHLTSGGRCRRIARFSCTSGCDPSGRRTP